MNSNQQSNEMLEMLEGLAELHRNRIRIGKIVSVFDREHPEYLDELFFVIGFQQNFKGDSKLVAVMDREFKTFVTDIDNIILKELFTIDDMFPAKSKVTS